MSTMEERVADEYVSESSHSAELNVRISRLEYELTQTNEKLRSTQKQLLDVERRCAISEATCSELKQQIAVILTTLEDFKSLNRSNRSTANCSVDASAQCDSQVDVVGICATSALSMGTTTTTTTAATTTTTTTTAANENVSDTNQWPTDGSQMASVAECVKVAAESAVEESRFIFDSETRMYYDCLSGYYYDAEKSLYYEPHSGMYFYYDSSNQSYKYHSKVDEDKFNLLTHIIFKRSSSVEELNRKNRRLRRSNKQNPQSSNQPTPNADSLSNETSNKLSTTATTTTTPAAVTTTTTGGGGVVDGEQPCVREDCSKESEANSQLQSTDTAMEINEVVLELPQNNNYTEQHEQEVDSDTEEELEDGELTSSASENESEAVEMVPEPVMQHCTPCIRLMVTCSDCLSVGSLFIITCTGGTIGRDVDLGHTIVIPDPQVSKMHCSVSYSEDRQRYVIKDHASGCGTFINDKRLSKAKTISEPHVVYHSDVLKISSTTFELHIHPRLETCSSCEPGCVQQPMSTTQQNDIDVASQKDKEQERRRQLKRLRTKFGLAAMNYENHPSLHHNKSYQDRAAQRRDTVGSDGPVIDRVEPSSVHRAISEQNVGHKLLSKLGWKEGESLGKSNEGILEPINVEVRVKASAGLGAYSGSHLSMDDVHQSAAAERWIKTQDRYARLTAAEQTDNEQTCSVSQSSLGPIKWTKSQGSNV